MGSQVYSGSQAGHYNVRLVVQNQPYVEDSITLGIDFVRKLKRWERKWERLNRWFDVFV